MKNTVYTVIQWAKKLPDKKNHVEFITAVLSVPVMLTVIILNLNNLSQQKNNVQKQSPATTAVPIQIVITGDKQKTTNDSPIINTSEPTSTPTPTIISCIKAIGPVSIIFPRENEVVSNNPVCVTISSEEKYCSIKWSYRLDNGDWSDYTDSNICLRNLMNGTRIIQLKIKSTNSEDVATLQRSFIYQGNSDQNPTPIASASANL